MAENPGWKDEFDALPAHIQARVRVAAECFGVPLIAAYYRAKGLGLLDDSDTVTSPEAPIVVDVVDQLKKFARTHERGFPQTLLYTKEHHQADLAIIAEVERLRTGIKRLSDEEELCAETTGDDPFSLVYLAAKLAAVETENKRLLASMRRVEDYHRAKAAGIWETSREGLTEDQSKEYGIAWCVHAAAAYEIKQLASPDTRGSDV